MRLLVVVFGVVLAGVTVAFAQQDAFAQQGDLVEDLGGSTEATQSQAATPVPPPPSAQANWPCRFGPITKRIKFEDAEEIIWGAPTRRAAWYAILAREEDEGAEPLKFYVAASDDGLGDGLVCPDKSSP